MVTSDPKWHCQGSQQLVWEALGIRHESWFMETHPALHADWGPAEGAPTIPPRMGAMGTMEGRLSVALLDTSQMVESCKEG